MYVLDCRNAFRAFVRVLMGVAVRDVKKLAAAGLLWNVRMGDADLKADLDTAPRAEVILNGCRIENAILGVIVVSNN
jgi:hypothetical protein